jgi:LacI family transcriptional regulator
LQKHRISLDPTCVFSCGSYEVAAGDAFARTFFEVPRDLTAIVFANDALASGFMRVAHQRKIRIPEDLSIVGFDGLPEDELLWPALTSVAQPMLEMGSAACRRLFEAIDSPRRLQTIQFPMSLTARESTAAPRVRVWPVASSAS